jgi:type IV pilus assembly protein PilM
VAGIQDIFKPAAGTRPRLACEIRPEGVVAARVSAEKRGATETVLAFAPTSAGVLRPGLKVPNLADRAAVIAALESALGATNARDRDVTVVVPDAAARVLLLDFDALPTRRQEALQVVTFRLRKMVPFDVETAVVSYQVMAQKGSGAKSGQLSLLVTIMPGEVLEEYEGVVREAGYEPGAVLPSTLAAVAGLNGNGAALIVNHSLASVTTAVTNSGEMLLHRTMDLAGEGDAREEEMAQAVITALAWYEDTLKATPEKLHYAGMGGAKAANESRWLRMVNPAPPIDELPLPAGASMLTSIPSGSTAGVTGALAS